jgi:hypothetical protein
MARLPSTKEVYEYAKTSRIASDGYLASFWPASDCPTCAAILREREIAIYLLIEPFAAAKESCRGALLGAE